MKVKDVLDRNSVAIVGKLVLRRAGTALAVFCVSKGLPAETVDALLAAIGVVFGIGWDLALTWKDKKKTQNEAIRSVVEALPKAGADNVFEKYDAVQLDATSELHKQYLEPLLGRR